MFAFGHPRPPRRIALTPMIDVVFLLLVFFMLVARTAEFGALELSASGGEATWSGPPRLVAVAPGGVALNGVAVDEAGLVAALAPLVARPSDPVVLRPMDGASLQRLADVAEALAGAGYVRLVLVE